MRGNYEMKVRWQRVEENKEGRNEARQKGLRKRSKGDRQNLKKTK